MTGSEVFAVAHAVACGGPYRCLFCGAPAADSYELKDTFTARSTLFNGRSGFVCRGCLLTLEESGTARYPDGTSKEWSRAFRRSNTWCWSAAGAVPFAGSHLGRLREWLLSPPPPPWGACLVGPTNGRQLLYLTPATLDRRWHRVLVEGERVEYDPPALVRRLSLILRVAGIAGRPVVDERPTVVAVSALLADAGGELLAAAWGRVWSEPLTRLAAFLTPKREDCADAIRWLESVGGAYAAAAHAG